MLYEEDGTMQVIAKLSAKISARFPDYWSSGIMCSSPLEPDFTGVGCIVLVRRSAARDVFIFDFGAGSRGGWTPITTLDEPLVRPSEEV